MAVVSASGNIGKDGELKFIPSGKAVLTFPVASKHGFGDKATTTWFECEVWGNFAEAIAEKIKKGSKVSFSGNFWLDQWESQGGKKGTTARVNIIEIDVQNLSQRDESRSMPPEPPPMGGNGEDLPF